MMIITMIKKDDKDNRNNNTHDKDIDGYNNHIIYLTSEYYTLS